MPEPFPPELEQFVRQELASATYRSRENLIVEAVRLLRDSKTGLRRLQEQVKLRLDRLDRGEGIELDAESLGEFFDEVESEVQEELAGTS